MSRINQDIVSTFDAAGVNAAIKSVNSLDREVSKVTRGFEKFAGLLAGGGAFYKLASFAKESLDINEKYVSSLNLLTNSLSRVGVRNSAYTDQLAQMASALELKTNFDELDIINIQRSAIEHRFLGDEMKRLIPAVLDFSAATGKSGTEAISAISKALNGGKNSLKEYGVEIDNSKSKAENFDKIIAVLNQRFGGAAEQQLTDYQKNTKALSESMEDLQKSIAGVIAQPLADWFKAADNVFKEVTHAGETRLQTLRRKLQDLRDDSTRAEVEQGIKNAYAFSIGKTEKEIAELVAAEKKVAEDIKRAKTTAESESGPRNYKPRSPVSMDMGAGGKLDLKKNDPVGEWKATLDRKLAASIQFNNRQAELDDNAAAAESARQAKKKQDYADTLSTIASLASSNNGALAAIGKAGAIAQATISTYVGVAKAWELGPILGPILAPVVFAAGMAQVAAISGVALAEGGMAMPSAGGTIARIAEAGKAEAVIPLDDARTKAKLADIFGVGTNITVGGPTINITGGISNALDVKKVAAELQSAMRKGMTEAVNLANVSHKVGLKNARRTSL